MATSVKLIDSYRSSGFNINDKESRDVARAILHASRQYGGTESSIPPISISQQSAGDASKYFMWYFDETFHRFPVKSAMAVAAEELLNGNGRSRAAVLRFLNSDQYPLHSGYGGMSGMDGMSGSSIDSFTYSSIIRGCVALVDAETSNALLEELPNAQRELASKWAYEILLNLCNQRGIDPLSIPPVKKLITSKPPTELSKFEKSLLGIKVKNSDLGEGMGVTEMGEMEGYDEIINDASLETETGELGSFATASINPEIANDLV